MKVIFKILLLGAILSPLCYVGIEIVHVGHLLWQLKYPSPTANISFIQKNTGIRFSTGITQYTEFDDFLGSVTAHLTLPQNEIQSFIKQYHFIKIVPIDSLSDRDMSHLAVPFNKIPNSVNYMLNGQNRMHFWKFVLDSHSGNLWIQVRYPGHNI
jgi:hypothetical protein